LVRGSEPVRAAPADSVKLAALSAEPLERSSALPEPSSMTDPRLFTLLPATKSTEFELSISVVPVTLYALLELKNEGQ
jgi:hypothetical protein